MSGRQDAGAPDVLLKVGLGDYAACMQGESRKISSSEIASHPGGSHAQLELFGKIFDATAGSYMCLTFAAVVCSRAGKKKLHAGSPPS